ncbi:MAG: 3-5 exonuclease [Frankiales bacterium]|nr:3-5 exonuclease [Frankiales bacterium]
MTTTRPGPDGEVTGDEPEVTPLLVPREGVPPVTQTAAQLADVVARFAAGTGPIAVDAERASGYRYSQRAYLVQLRREGAGSALVDPIACPDLSLLGKVLQGDEWVLHAASQDIPCLAEVGMEPPAVFDTELAGRLAGFERVGLGAMVENVLGYRLEKGHSAADWSTRPLPDDWLVYAALDVEVLLELRDALEAELDRQGKLEWAHQEFEAVRLAPAPGPRVDPWRRTSGIHRLRTRRQLAGVRAMWELRDQMARRRDTAPGRILPDAAIIGAVSAAPATSADLVALPVFKGRSTRRHVDVWWGALQKAAALTEEHLPQSVPTGDGPPPPSRWAERDPVAAKRLARVRSAVTELAEAHNMPAENLVPPDSVRRLAWNLPAAIEVGAVRAALAGYGARPWQVDLVAEALTSALPPPPE